MGKVTFGCDGSVTKTNGTESRSIPLNEKLLVKKKGATLASLTSSITASNHLGCFNHKKIPN